MPTQTLSKFFLLPELKLSKIKRMNRLSAQYYCQKSNTFEICPKCATPSRSVYDHRMARIKDAPIRGHGVLLCVRKRRLWCNQCQKPFTEPLAGIKKGKRHTERYAAGVLWACENFSDLKRVRQAYRCSASFLYKIYYQQLERKCREKLNYPWPKIIGIDEHGFRKNPNTNRTEFASSIIDYVNSRPRELVEGKTSASLELGLSHIPGRENVLYAVVDLCDPFKNFVRNFFPNAALVADKFHVLRLLSPSLLQKRKEITGTRADLRAKKLLLMSSKRLDYFSRLALEDFLSRYPQLHELYCWKEKLHSFYRIKGYQRAKNTFIQICDEMAGSCLSEIKTLRRTLIKWQEEILNYFKTGLTNAKTEGFNNVAKVIKRKAYGYRNFKNYRLKFLMACH